MPSRDEVTEMLQSADWLDASVRGRILELIPQMNEEELQEVENIFTRFFQRNEAMKDGLKKVKPVLMQLFTAMNRSIVDSVDKAVVQHLAEHDRSSNSAEADELLKQM